LVDQRADARERLAPPITQLLDPRIDELRGGASSALLAALALVHD
jgi:hypothetical protein